MLRDAEIFATGTWNDQQFTDADLDGIVSSFHTLGLSGRLPVKLGHEGPDARTDGSPALGWIENVRREGSKLLADIKLTSEKLAQVIKDGAYKFVSIELLRNVQASTRQIPWVLDAIALLGTSAPAVGVLKEIQASMQSFRRGGLRLRGERLAFTKRENVNQSGDTTGMDEAAVKAAIEKAVGDATAKFTAQIDGLKTQLSAANDETKKAKAETHRQQVLAPLDAAIKDGTLNAAARDQFINTFAVADDAAVFKVTTKTTEEFVDSVKDIAKFKGPGKRSQKVVSKAEDEIPQGATNAEAMTFVKDRRILATNGKLENFEDQERAHLHVLRANKYLASRYFDDPQGKYEPPTNAA
jgi:hypothetical protein